MLTLTPITSKFTATQGSVQEIYYCPTDKTHAIVDVTFFKPDSTQDSTISIALTSDSNPANLTSVDYFIDDIELIGLTNSVELNKVVIGSGERLYVTVASGGDCNVRVTGVEESAGTKIVAAGRLAASVITGTTQTQIFDNTYTNAAYSMTSITIFNTNTTNNANVQMWITDSSTPVSSDQIMSITITPQDTAILKNVQLLPGEKIYVQSDQDNNEYFINGMVISN